MSKWERGKTVNLLTLFMQDPEARKNPRVRDLIKHLRAEQQKAAAENANTLIALYTINEERFKTNRRTTTRRKTASGSNRRRTRNANR
jgi:hypothetical protein